MAMGELDGVRSDLAQLARLALGEQTEDVRLLVARYVRKYRSSDRELADRLDEYLRTNKPQSRGGVLRKAPPAGEIELSSPVADESGLALLKTFDTDTVPRQPLLPTGLHDTLTQLIQERRQADRLAAKGLSPTRSAVFTGPPGVGKTVTARWIAAELGLPFYVLDLTAVMSSLLGRSGANLRAALDFAKRTPSVLLLDELDAMAKRRADASDVGEFKRLVTVILQEVDEWPDTGLLLAATNHPELIDPALWRRFDLVVEFAMPDRAQVVQAITQFLGDDVTPFTAWLDIMALTFGNESFSDIERELRRFRRALALGTASVRELVEAHAARRAGELDHRSRIELAVRLAEISSLSQHRVSELTGISRDTIRKHVRGRSSASDTAAGARAAR